MLHTPVMKLFLFLCFKYLGSLTFVLSIVGVFIGHKFGDRFKSKAEFVGGVILVLMGVKILLEHLEIITF